MTDQHFSVMTSHLADIVDAASIADEVAAELLDLVAAHREDVVSGSAVADT